MRLSAGRDNREGGNRQLIGEGLDKNNCFTIVIIAGTGVYMQ